ncbi:MAG: hypothetical protein BWY44_00251 [Candidatus Omnitrophica bacterium ADurb.Bin292]|nr:MAG: hypothetical protein BWY44_00251 [Candidatus Omnitrophica bacterium ADurb.Bin292]
MIDRFLVLSGLPIDPAQITMGLEIRLTSPFGFFDHTLHHSRAVFMALGLIIRGPQFQHGFHIIRVLVVKGLQFTNRILQLPLSRLENRQFQPDFLIAGAYGFSPGIGLIGGH